MLATATIIAVVAVPYTWARVWSHATAVNLRSRADAAAPSWDAASRSLRVGCFNIAHGRGGVYGASNWDGGTAAERRQRLDEIANLITSLDLDIVVLNEVDFDAVWSRGVDQAAAIATAADYPFIARQRNADILLPFATMRFGNAVLSRFPLTSARRIALPPASTHERILAGAHHGMVTRVQLDDDLEIDVIAIHLEARNRAARLESVPRLEPFLRERDVPVLLLGDFNATFDASPDTDPTALERLMNFGNHRLIPEPADAPNTFPSEAPNRTIDWIMAPIQWSVISSAVVPTDLSDHLPVVAELRLPPMVALEHQIEPPSHDLPWMRKDVDEFPPLAEDTATGLAAWLDWPWKLHRIDGDTVELYDLSEDPMETRDRSQDPAQRQRREQMTSALDTWMRSVVRRHNGDDFRRP